MKQVYLLFIICFTCLWSFSQNSFHVFPKDSKINPGSSVGDGSLENPWDLQTALNQKPERVNGGDTIWLHNGVYTGRFVSRLKSTLKGKQIVVSSYNNQWAILNGNVNSSQKEVLSVYSQGVTFQNFEITWLGNFPRHVNDLKFQRSDGINHYSGQNCIYLNLRIHNNPGSGFGSWKHTSNARIENCIIYNNGFFSEKRGRGVGIYVQNASDEMRIIKNNIIFNNYYKGVEIWSASRKAKFNYVKNVLFEDNVLFNSGLVSGRFRDNLIIATDDITQNNIASNIIIRNNIFYHNVSLNNAIENTEAPSLSLGFNAKAPIENVLVEDNVIIGRKDAIRFLSVNSITFKNNTVYSGYIRFTKNNLNHIDSEHWKFNNNKYFTRKSNTIRIQGLKDYNLSQWVDEFGLDKNSNWQSYKDFELDHPIKISKNPYQKNTYRVTVISSAENDVSVDFSRFNLPLNSKYKIRDVENYNTILNTGQLDETSNIVIPMNVEQHPSKTLNNFGVYIISFENPVPNEDEKDGFFKNLFKWLGF